MKLYLNKPSPYARLAPPPFRLGHGHLYEVSIGSWITHLDSIQSRQGCIRLGLSRTAREHSPRITCETPRMRVRQLGEN